MSDSILKDAFEHHIWATLTLIDACAGLPPEDLETSPDGTFGSIIETMRHIVGADCSYVSVISGGAHQATDTSAMDMAGLRAEMAQNAQVWRQVAAADLDPDRVLTRHRPDGSASHAPVGVRIAQVLHHGTDHRSQICTALTILGQTPPDIDVWDYASTVGRLRETLPGGE